MVVPHIGVSAESPRTRGWRRAATAMVLVVIAVSGELLVESILQQQWIGIALGLGGGLWGLPRAVELTRRRR